MIVFAHDCTVTRAVNDEPLSVADTPLTMTVPTLLLGNTVHCTSTFHAGNKGGESVVVAHDRGVSIFRYSNDALHAPPPVDVITVPVAARHDTQVFIQKA